MGVDSFPDLTRRGGRRTRPDSVTPRMESGGEPSRLESESKIALGYRETTEDRAMADRIAIGVVRGAHTVVARPTTEGQR